MYKDKTVLITGGTGFIGSSLVEKLMRTNVKKVISFSRRWDDSERLKKDTNDDRLRVINGDICNPEIFSAMQGVDYVIHAAAYKSVPSGEYNPFECKRVNVDGTENVIKAALRANVKKVLFISSDKACDPINTYGRAKALSESMVINSNIFGGTKFSVVRYGNVLGSTGSVLPVFQRIIANGYDVLPVTDLEMTRFWFRKDDATDYVLSCLEAMDGGETYIPKLRSSTMMDLIGALDIIYEKSFDTQIIGKRPGEKMHESMLNKNEGDRAYDYNWTYVIEPMYAYWGRVCSPIAHKVGKEYTSDGAGRFTIMQLVKEIQSAI